MKMDNNMTIILYLKTCLLICGMPSWSTDNTRCQMNNRFILSKINANSIQCVNDVIAIVLLECHDSLIGHYLSIKNIGVSAAGLFPSRTTKYGI